MSLIASTQHGFESAADRHRFFWIYATVRLNLAPLIVTTEIRTFFPGPHLCIIV